MRRMEVLRRAVPALYRPGCLERACIRTTSSSQRSIHKGSTSSSLGAITSRAFSSTSMQSQLVSVQVPQLAESISEGTVASFSKAVGDWVEADEEIASIETDKIDVNLNSPRAGSIAELLVAEGDTVTVGQQVARIDVSNSSQQASEKSAEPTREKSTNPAPPTAATTKETGHDQPKAKGDDQVRSFSGPPQVSLSTAATSMNEVSQGTTYGSPVATGRPRVEREEKMTRMRKTIAARLKKSQNICASLTTMQEVDMSNLIAWRAKYRAELLETKGVRLGYMGAFTKATSLAAQAIPAINGAIDTDRELITFRNYVDISIAVSTPKGLLTPVLRNCESLSIVDLEREIAVLAEKARSGKLTMDDLRGGNYTISNPGIFGSMFGTPLINYPQAAVFNMNSIKDRVVVQNGEIRIRPMRYISLTYDHRLIDGREAVGFLNKVKRYIEDPAAMSL